MLLPKICKDYLDEDNIPSFDNLNKPSNLNGVLNSKTININIENVDSTNLEILFVHRLYGDSSTQINSPSISMLSSERFIEMNSATYFGSYMLYSDVVTLIQGEISVQVNVNINDNLPDNLLVVPINNKAFILIGGWSAKCFTKSDEKWINNWSKKINNIFSKNKI